MPSLPGRASLDDLLAAEADAAQEHLAWITSTAQAKRQILQKVTRGTEGENTKRHLSGQAAVRKHEAKTKLASLPAEEPELWQELKVAHVAVLVREEPHHCAKVCGALKQGTSVWASEETFDGWVSVYGPNSWDKPAGWVLRDMQGVVGVGKLLAFSGDSCLLAAHQFSEQPGPQYFEVVVPGGVDARWEPDVDADVLYRLEFGQIVQGSTQTYNGWVRLPNAGAWVQAKSRQGRYLRATFLESDDFMPIARPAATTPVAPQSLQVPLRHWELLPLEFQVVQSAVMVRSQPSLASQACGAKGRGSVVHAVEATFDGWVRIEDPPGWILQDLGGQGGVGQLLKMIGVSQLIPAAEKAKEPGPQRFEVIAKDGVVVYKEPMEDSEVVDTFRPDFGQIVTAVSQTYEGWLRLADGVGWVRCRSHEDGRCLNALYMAEVSIRDAREQYQQAKEHAQREAEAEAKLEQELAAAKKSNVWDKVALGGRSIPAIGTAARGGHKYFEFRGQAELIAARHLGSSGWNILQLPERMFIVVSTDVIVRMEPKFSSAVCGTIRKGDAVAACEETFDGWVKLVDQPGWAPRDMGGRDSHFTVLEPMDTPEDMAVPEFSPGPSRRMFEVVFSPWVEITRQPRHDANVIGKRRTGEFVLAETQTYHGWLKLAEGLGWMPSISRERGQLLQSVSSGDHADPLLPLPAPEDDPEEQRREEERLLEERRRKMDEERRVQAALRELEAAAATGDGAVFRVAIKEAKRQGVPKKDIARVNALFSAG